MLIFCSAVDFGKKKKPKKKKLLLSIAPRRFEGGCHRMHVIDSLNRVQTTMNGLALNLAKAPLPLSESVARKQKRNYTQQNLYLKQIVLNVRL